MSIQKNQQLRIRNLVKTAQQVQSLLSTDQISDPFCTNISDLPASRQQAFQVIQAAVKRVDKIFQEMKRTASNLPIRSRRAYQWLRFLSEDDHFLDHIQTLQRIRALPVTNPKKPLQIQMYHFSPLYKITQSNHHIEAAFHESFINAPDSVLSALQAVFSGNKDSQYRTIIRNYTAGNQFRSYREHLEYLGVPENAYAQGNQWDLAAIFQSVNQRYFSGKIEKPHLTWSTRLTKRKFGHYQFDTDTVMISSSLDARDVPRAAVEFVVYHELLHKKLGYQTHRTRRTVHTKAFQAQERKFSGYQRAQRVLRRIARTV